MEIVRWPIAVERSTRRHLEERLGLRFPRLKALLARAVWARLNPQSRLRNALIRRFARLGPEANNRGDHEAALLLYHPQVQATLPPQLAGLGIEAQVNGREERVQLQARWQEEWGVFRINPSELLLAGDCFVLLVGFETTGLSSGASAIAEGAFVVTISDGLVTREHVFLDQRAALEAAGLSRHYLEEHSTRSGGRANPERN